MDNKKKHRDIVETELSFHPREEAIISEVQKDFIQDEIGELPPIKEGDVNISAAYVFDEGDKLELSIYIRNGLDRAVNFEKVPLLLINSKEETLASQIFDLSEVGDVPALSVRPWKIYFDKENVNMDKFSMEDWKLVFDTNIKAVKYVDIQLEDLPKEFDDDTVLALQSYVDSLPKLEEGQFSISTFYVKENEDGSLSVTLILRNATDKGVKLEKLPVTVNDAKGTLAAKGTFENIDLNINAYKATVREFIFLKEQRVEEELDLESWTVQFE